MPDLSPRRRQLLDAAISVAARQGLRGLTHRAVDREAGLPEGTCSAYLRTRDALQKALAEHVTAGLSADVSTLTAALTADGGESPAALTSELFQRWLRHPEPQLARLELTLEATRDPDLAALLARSRADLVALVDAVRPDADHAETMVAALDGVLLAALLEPAGRRRALLDRALTQLMEEWAGA